MVKMINKIKEIVKKECEKDINKFIHAYESHFIPMVNYAKELSIKTGADKEIVEIAAWLHDIGSIIGDYKNHHISSTKYAEDLLKKFNYPKDKIEQVKHCIIAHRGSKEIPRESIEAKCVASADAMSHFDVIHNLFYLALIIKKLNVDESKEFVKKKLENSWNKLIPEAKIIIKPKYEATKIILK